MHELKHLSVSDLCDLYPAVFCVDANYKLRASILAPLELCAPTPPVDFSGFDVQQAAA